MKAIIEQKGKVRRLVGVKGLIKKEFYKIPACEQISDGAFRDQYLCKSVYVPDSCGQIFSYAFAGCFDLQQISLPKDLQILDSFAFEACISLKKIIFRGTKHEFENVMAFDDWNSGCNAFIVECTDDYISIPAHNAQVDLLWERILNEAESKAM